MKKIILFIFILLFSIESKSQQVYFGYPEKNIQLNMGDVIIIEPFCWHFPGFDSTIISYATDLKNFMLENDSFSFEINIYTDYIGKDSFNMGKTKDMAWRFGEYLKGDTVFKNKASYGIYGRGETNLLINEECIEKNTSEKYRDALRILNRRVEIEIERKE